MAGDKKAFFTRLFLITTVVASSTAITESAFSQAPADQDAPWYAMGRDDLEVVVDLASPFEPSRAARREAMLDSLADEIREADRQLFILQMAYMDDAAEDFRALAPAPPDSVSDVLWAFRESFVRFRGAREADDPEWMRRHLERGKEYASRAAEGLLAQARSDEGLAVALRSEPYAVRQSADEASLDQQRLQSEGLSPEHRRLLAKSGLAEAQISAYEQDLQSVPSDSLGISIVELYEMLAELRRVLAAELEAFAGPGVPAPPSLSQTFMVGNPHDRQETIDLFIQLVSMPPQWDLSIVAADTASGEGSRSRLQEVKAGEHYRIRLPARAQIRLTSVVFPIGIVGQNTTARWAIEGKIRNELIGGIVHEMVVPAMAAAAQRETTGTQDSWFGWPTLAFAAAVLVLATLGLIIFILLRRRTEA